MARPPRGPRRARSGVVLYLLGGLLLAGALVGVTGLTARLGPDGDLGAARLVAFGGVLAGWLLVFMGFGLEVSGDALGLLNTARNRYSLSRLQMVLWTWLVLSAVLAAAAARAWGLGGSLETAFAIRVDPDVFAAMGVSFFTAAATPAVLSLKGRDADEDTTFFARRTREPLMLRGGVVARPSGAPPRLGDLVKGDDAGSSGEVDLSKVQQLMITVILVGVYAAMLGGFFAGAGFAAPDPGSPGRTLSHLPAFPKDMIELLVLSHAGYLGYKAAPKPRPADDGAPLAGGPPPTPRAGG